MANQVEHAERAPAVVWLRHELRLADNPALHAAAQSGRPLVVLYVLDDAAAGRWRAGGASRWWLHHSLASLERDIAARGGRLTLRRGLADQLVPALCEEAGAAALHFSHAVEPYQAAQDARVAASLRGRGVEVREHEGAGLFAPGEIRNGQSEPFKVFSPFWRACLKAGRPREPLPAPASLEGPELPSEPLQAWALLPTRPDWAGGLREAWTPGEALAHQRLQAFLAAAVKRYGVERNAPGMEGTSRLSPHLHFGEISPVQIWAAAERAEGDTDKFLSEVGWREFSRHLLWQFPELPERNFRPQFDRFPWGNTPELLEAWRRGRTGYPIVDAGMRQLWGSGWMHNRVRMICASFLVKHLLIDWREGEAWFWDTLVDADLANNSASWQWVAGSGADAAPYFRVFNPITQAEKFDPEGGYIRRWVPELAKLPAPAIFAPWQASPLELAAGGVRLGETYPAPIVDHSEARTRALAAFERIKG